MINHRFIAVPIATVATLLLFITGCGTAAYEERLMATQKRLAQTAKFLVLYDMPVPIADDRVFVRIPKIFTQTPISDANAIDTMTSKPYTPDRLNPPFLKDGIPGLRVTYEQTMRDVESHQMPVYLYLAATTAAETAKTGKPLTETLREQIAGAFPKETVQWDLLEADTPELDKPKNPWKVLRVAGEQDFKLDVAPLMMPGKFRLYLYEAQGYQVLVGWRAPDTTSSLVNIDELGPLVAGTIEVKGPPPPPPAAPAAPATPEAPKP